VVDEPGDRLDPQIAKAIQTFIGPGPICLLVRVMLPQDRVSERADSEFGDSVEIIEARAMPAEFCLVEVTVAHSVYRTLNPAPNFQLG
jgi:hypothetical protein